MAQFDPSRPDFAPYGFDCSLWTPTPMRRADRHNEIELNLLTEGSVTYLLSGRSVTIPPGRLAIFWGAVPHQVMRWEGQSAYFVATIPLTWFLQRQFPEPFVHAVLHGELLLDDAPDPAGHDAQVFERWVHDMQRTDEAGRRVVLLEMEARLLRFAMSMPTKISATRPTKARAVHGKDDLDHVERMVQFVAQHYTEPLTVEEICQLTPLHPNYAMSLFRKAFGMTLIACVTQHRITHAQRLLVTTDRSVLDVAFDSGFGSLSRFNEAFKRACGCSPREFRAKH